MAQKPSSLYEDPKNNGNRKTDENIGGAEKGGPNFSKAQNRMPPDSELKDNHDSPVEGPRPKTMEDS